MYSAYAYLQARVQAKLDSRLASSDWQALETPASRFDLMDHIRNREALREWTMGLEEDPTPHAMERRLRLRCVDRVRAAGCWAPPIWQPAVEWVSELIYLPYLAYLANSGLPQSWMQEDPRLAPLCTEATDTGTGAPVLAANRWVFEQPGAELPRRWTALWQERWPKVTKDMARSLRALAPELQRGAGIGFDLGQAKRNTALETRFVSRIHRFAFSPVSVFAFTGLLLLDWRRLRGALQVGYFFHEEEFNR